MDPWSVVSAQVALRATTTAAHSALPDAPVIAYVERISAMPRARAALAVGLRRAADAVAPRRPVCLCLDN